MYSSPTKQSECLRHSSTQTRTQSIGQHSPAYQSNRAQSYDHARLTLRTPPPHYLHHSSSSIFCIFLTSFPSHSWVSFLSSLFQHLLCYFTIPFGACQHDRDDPRPERTDTTYLLVTFILLFNTYSFIDYFFTFTLTTSSPFSP